MAKRPTPQDLPGVDGPGVSRPKYKDLDKLADKFCELRDGKANLASEMGDVEKKIIEKMDEHGLSVYHYGDQKVELKGASIHIKVKTVKVEAAEEPEEKLFE